MTTRRTIVVPCYNEAARLDVAALVGLASQAEARVLAVDDGSTDATGALLIAAAAAHPDRFGVVSRPTNGGKGEAVRDGLLAAIDAGAELVGYYDADMATPPAEMARLLHELAADDRRDVVIGSRVGLLGHDIERSPWRHYLGRLFATASGVALGLAVYDTQCGAKALRVTPALRCALARPFRSRWAFDVELLGRLLDAGVAPAAFVEIPLRTWRDVGGSKLGAASALAAGRDVVRVGWTRRRRSRG